MPTGWLCPRCARINAPFVRTCDCKPKPAVKPLPSWAAFVKRFAANNPQWANPFV